MKRPVLIFLLLAGGLSFSACNKHIYVPNTVNAPLLKERYEFKGSVSPTNYQAAFAVTNHVAIMANGQYVFRPDFNSGDESEDGLFVDQYVRGGLFEGAVGFFQPLDSRKRMVFDTYAGFGAGSFKTLDVAFNDESATGNNNDYLLRAHFSKVFIQPSIGFVHPAIEAAFSSRISMLNFYDQYLGNKVFETNPDRRDNFMRVGSKSRFFFEPAFTFRAGYKYVKFQMQLSFAVPMEDETYSGYEVSQYFQPVAFGMGASVNIAQWYNEFRKK
ncbi:hypothetical protein F0L74_15310 [Chitinophaga agrisoli]|uniref:Outer membrane protein with beta-barrel domain n=1 Tax=Chitinophaga agrisoli TaxID=2607653 RepID=A0A5B2VRH7_9BACT|nr:hypothetical protein [Chitinophaga agrisoli]KAA2241278.1 hypothetical protein F0L74_15310 [Chitinophaga agrisoli]